MTQFRLLLVLSFDGFGLGFCERPVERRIGEREGDSWDLMKGLTTAEGLWMAILFTVAIEDGVSWNTRTFKFSFKRYDITLQAYII